jgi:hypothetical protein
MQSSTKHPNDFSQARTCLRPNLCTIAHHRFFYRHLRNVLFKMKQTQDWLNCPVFEINFLLCYWWYSWYDTSSMRSRPCSRWSGRVRRLCGQPQFPPLLWRHIQRPACTWSSQLWWHNWFAQVRCRCSLCGRNNYRSRWFQWSCFSGSLTQPSCLASASLKYMKELDLVRLWFKCMFIVISAKNND